MCKSRSRVDFKGTDLWVSYILPCGWAHPAACSAVAKAPSPEVEGSCVGCPLLCNPVSLPVSCGSAAMMSLRVRAEFWPSKIGAQPRAGASLLLDSLVMHPQDRTPTLQGTVEHRAAACSLAVPWPWDLLR